jgi:hypothetical protein
MEEEEITRNYIGYAKILLGGQISRSLYMGKLKIPAGKGGGKLPRDYSRGR